MTNRPAAPDERGPLRTVVVTGATGNLGTALLRRLSLEPGIGEVRAVARRRADVDAPGVRMVPLDVARDDLGGVMEGADTVVHLAWQLQPMRSPELTWSANVGGSRRVFDAAVAHGAGSIVYVSSVGAYGPGAGQLVDERWPTDALPTSGYGREKAYVERVLDALEARHPEVRVVRLRPAFVLQRAAASQQRLLFAGRLLPTGLLRPGRIPFLPFPRGMRFQVVHADDVADALCLAVVSEARGPFNLAADPPIDGPQLAELLGARIVAIPPELARIALAVAFHAHLVPTEPGMFDLARSLPLLRTDRATEELGWKPRHGAAETLEETLAALAAGDGGSTPPLRSDAPPG